MKVVIRQLNQSSLKTKEKTQALEVERKTIVKWRTEWDLQLNMTIKKFEMDRAIMNNKLMKFGYVYDDELHTVRPLTKTDKSAGLATVNKYIKDNKDNMKAWSLVSILNHTYCADDVYGLQISHLLAHEEGKGEF